MRDRLKLAMPWVVSAFILIATVAVQCVALSAKLDVLSPGFWTNLAVNVGIIGIVAIVWLYAGRDKAGRLSEDGNKTPYQYALDDYGAEVNRVQEGHITEFTEYCEKKTEELRHRKELALLHSVCLEWEQFEELKGKAKKELRKKLTRKQVAAVRKVAERKVKIKPVNPIEILTDSKIKDEYGYGVHYNENADVATMMALKIAQSIVMSFVLAVLVVQVTENIRSLDVWVMFAMKLALVVSNAWSGYITGYGLVAERKKKVLRKRVDFIKMFFEQKKPGE